MDAVNRRLDRASKRGCQKSDFEEIKKEGKKVAEESPEEKPQQARVKEVDWMRRAGCFPVLFIATPQKSGPLVLLALAYHFCRALSAKF